MKKLLPLLLTLMLVFASCGENTPSPEDTSSAPDTYVDENLQNGISIPVTPGDSLNPYTVKSSVNLSIIPLIYNSLTVTLSDFTAEMSVAESVTRISDTSWSVTLKPGVLFSDGSELTAPDVVFSFNALKSSGGYYSGKLSSLVSATATGNTVVFTSKTPDRYLPNILDFPLTKASSGTKNPIGGGRYNPVNDGGGYSLVPNPRYFVKTDYTFDRIELIPMQYNDSLYTAIKSGLVDFLPAELSLGNYLGTTGKERSVPTSDLLYLGVGSVMSDVSLRKTVSDAVNRNHLGDYIPESDITPSSLPVHPSVPEVFSLDMNSRFSDVAEDAVKDTEINLLYSSDSTEKSDIAGKLKEYIEKTGIKVNLVGKSYADYRASVYSGNFDLYIGEIKLPDSLSLWTLFDDPAFNVNPSAELREIYYAFGSQKNTADVFLTAFGNELPFIPLGFKNSALAYTKSISSRIVCAVSDCYYNIQNAE